MTTLPERLRAHAELHAAWTGAEDRQFAADLREAADLIEGKLRPSPAGTVRVRIACAVIDAENWCASGLSSEGVRDEVDDRMTAEDNAAGGAIRWIEADVPLPDEPTIEGEVTR